MALSEFRSLQHKNAYFYLMTRQPILAFVLSFWSIIVFAQPQRPFEGVITYLVTPEVKDKDNPYNKFYTQKYGDTLAVYYHKSGSERRVYNHTGSFGLEWEIYNKFSNERYSKWNGIDSVFYTSAADTSTRLLALNTGDTLTILDKPCTSLIAISMDIFTEKMNRQTLYFSSDEYIPPHAYKGRKYGHQDSLYAASESLFLRWDIDEKYVHVVYEAIAIEPLTVDPNLFIIPKGLSKIKN